MSLAEVIADLTAQAADKQRQVSWGQVIDTSPTLIRFAGDASGDTQVDLRLSAYTPTTGDKVLLIRVGTGWCVVGELVTS